MIVTATIDNLCVTQKNNIPVRHPALNNQHIDQPFGVSNYKKSKKFIDGRIEAFSPDKPDMGCHMIYGGECLRNISTISGLPVYEVHQYHHNSGHKVTRMDIAVDVHNSGLSITELNEITETGKAKTFSKSAHHIKASIGTGQTLYFGWKTDKTLRIYDKGAETGLGGDWIRFELQVRGKYIQSVSKLVADAIDKAETIKALIKGYVDFDHDIWGKIMDAPMMRGTVNKETKNKTRQWILSDVASAMSKLIVNGDTDIQNDFIEEVSNRVRSMIAQIRND